MEQYVKGFQRFYAGKDVPPVTSALARFYHLFQVYYKVRQVLLQSATAIFVTKCDGLLLQSATAFLLLSVTSVITKCDRYYKVRRLLQSATVHTSLVNILNWAQYLLKRKFLRNCSKNYLNTILKNR